MTNPNEPTRPEDTTKPQGGGEADRNKTETEAERAERERRERQGK